MNVTALVFPAAALAAAGSLFALVALATAASRPPRRFCPGRRSWLLLLLPWRWFRRSICGYDLSGSPREEGGGVLCPECGTRHTNARRLLRRTAAWRTGRLAAAMFAGAVACAHAGTRDGRWAWTHLLPNAPLLATERLLRESTPEPIRCEVDERIEAGTLSTDQSASYAQSLVRDLAADRVRFNAQRAAELLHTIGDPAYPALRRALRSEDWQTRQWAAHILRQAHGAEISDDLVTVTIEGLANDGFPYGRHDGDEAATYSCIDNAFEGVTFLVLYAGRTHAALLRAMASEDRQQRLLAAAVAGWAGCSELAPEAAPILIDHLGDNTMRGDARLACAALFRLGAPAVEALEQAADSPDRQRAQAARYLLGRLGMPAYAGSRPPRITVLSNDPASCTLREALEDLR